MIARAIRGQDFYGLLGYLIEKRILHPDAIRASDNLLSIDTAAREMTIVAAGNRRCTMPVRHIILAWREDERPSITQQHECAEALLQRLGVDSHQNIRVVHTEDKSSAKASGDGRHYEIHIAINAVGPTGKAPGSTRDWSTIEIATSWVANQYGFAEIPGRFNGIGSGPGSSRNGKAQSVAAQTGILTIADEITADPDRLERLIVARQRSKNTRSWKLFLHELDHQGLRLEQGKDRGKNRVRGLILVDKKNPDRRQKISALDTPALKWGEGALTVDLGEVRPEFFTQITNDDAVTGEPAPDVETSFEQPKTFDIGAEIERRMRRERSVLRERFKQEQDRIRQERERILTVKKAAWRKFQGRKAELLEAARTRRKFLYQMLPHHRRIRATLNSLFDMTMNTKLQDARAVFETEKMLSPPAFERWTTWSAGRLRTQEQLRQELLEEISMAGGEPPSAQDPSRSEPRPNGSRQGFAAAHAAARRARSVWNLHGSSARSKLRKLYLKRDREGERTERHRIEENRIFIRTAWAAAADVDHVSIQWNSKTRLKETLSSQHLKRELQKSGVSLESMTGVETVSVSVSALARWIGTAHGRDDRLAMVERAAASSRNEVDASLADKEEAARKIAEQERQRQADQARQRFTDRIRAKIRDFWALNPEFDHVIIQWNSGTRSAATTPSSLLVRDLEKSGVPVERVSDAKAISVSVSALTDWIRAGSDRVARLELVENAAASSLREADAVLAEEKEAARKVVEQERQRAEKMRQRDLGANRDLIRTSWALDPKLDHVVIQWNLGARSATTLPSISLVQKLQMSSVPLEGVAGAEAVSVSVSALANWIGTDDDRVARLMMVKQASASSRREAAAVRADKAEQERQRDLAENREQIKTHWFALSNSDRVTIRWNLKMRIAETEPARQLADSLQAAGIHLAPGLGDEAKIVLISDLAEWIGIRSNRGDRLLQVRRAAEVSKLEANILRIEYQAIAKQRADDAAEKAKAWKAEEDRRVAEAKRSEELEKARVWAQRWVDSAPKSELDLNWIGWVFPPYPMAAEEPLQRLTTDIQAHPELRAVSRLLAGGYEEVSVSATVMTEFLTTITPNSRSIWDNYGTLCHAADRANRAQQRAVVEALSWASAWIAPAPRSTSALGCLTWTLSGNAEKDDVFTRLCRSLNYHSTMSVQLNPQDRHLTIPIKPLRAVLQRVAPEHRAQWDQLARTCAAASRANDEWKSYQSKKLSRTKHGAQQRSSLDEDAVLPPVQITSWPDQVKKVLSARDGATQVILFSGPKRQAGAVHAFYKAARQYQIGGVYPGAPSWGDCFVVEIWKFGNSIEAFAKTSTETAEVVIRLLQAARDEHDASRAAEKTNVAPSETKKLDRRRGPPDKSGDRDR